MISRETEPAFYRPTERPLKDLSNEELQALFNLRASKVVLDPKGFWEDNRTVYWSMRHQLKSLYEIMLEIQSRYPKSEVYYEGKPPGPYFDQLLPLNEDGYNEAAELVLERKKRMTEREHRRVCGFKELPAEICGKCGRKMDE